MKTLLLTSLFVLLAAMPAQAGGGAAPGMRAPDFVLIDMNGNYVSLIALRGKVVVMNFWATWCPPCKLEMPSLERLNIDYRTKGVEVLAVSTDSSEKVIRNYMDETRLGLRVLHDSDGKVSRLYGVYSLPSTFIIDQSGTVVQHLMGEHDWDSPAMRAKIDALLKRASQEQDRKPEAAPAIFFYDRKNKNSF